MKTRDWALSIIILIIIAWGIIFSGIAQAGWQTHKNHWPRLIYETSDLERIKARVASDQEPYKTLWERIQQKARGVPEHGTNKWPKEFENASIAKDKAFVYAMTGDINRAQEAWDALLKMKCDAKYWDKDDIHDTLYMAQSLTAHCQAYDILRGAGFCPSSTHGKVRENLSKLTADLYKIGKDIIYWLNTNYQMKITSAVGTAAVTLNTEGDAGEWIGWSMTKFWQVFQELTTPEGGYAEGPSYLLYSAVNYLPFMRAYNLFMDGQGGNYKGYWIPNFLSDPRVKAVHDWGVKIRMPNGTRPGYDDSYYEPFVSAILASSSDTSGHATDHVPGTSTDHYAWDWYTYEPLPQAPGDHFFSDYNVDLSVDILCAFDAGMVRRPPDLNPTQFLPAAGNAVFRSHWGKGGTYLLLLGENGNMIARTKDPIGGPQESHEHPDNGGIVLYSHGELLGLDSGYAGWDKRGQTKEPNNHNIVTVEGNFSYYDYTTRNGSIDHHFDTDFLGFAEVLTSIDVGYREGNFPVSSTVDYRRTVLFPNHRYFVVVDALNPVQTGGSRQYHTYHWRLHGNGALGSSPDSLSGSYTHLEGQGGIWGRKQGKLLAFVTTDHDNHAITHYSDVHALQWEDMKTHEVLQVRKEIKKDTSRYPVRFLSILYPAGAPDSLPTITSLTGNAAGVAKIQESPGEGGRVGIVMTKENWNELTIPGSSTGVGEIKTNARILFAQLDPSSKKMNQVFAKNVSRVLYDGKAAFSAANWIYHVALGFDENRISGALIHTGNHGNPYFDIQTEWNDFIVTGGAVNKWQSMGGGVVRIWLNGNGEFWIFNKAAAFSLANPSFEDRLNYWEPYGDGDDYKAERVGGDLVAKIERSRPFGDYFGLKQRAIPCEPNTTYRLTLWVKTEAKTGTVAAALGNWGDPNTHKDFGYTGGTTDWKQISGTWTSGPGENYLDVVLFGSPDFSGKAYFDDVILEKVQLLLKILIDGPSSLGYKKNGIFVANVSNGSRQYNYQWYRQYDGRKEWEVLGTQQTETSFMLTTSYILKVDVQDTITGQKTSVTKRVEYEIN
jgi:hypothetical protein